METIAAKAGVECVLHKYHSPKALNFDRHHVVPEAWGGTGETVVLCPSGHRNVHVLLDELVKMAHAGEVALIFPRHVVGGSTEKGLAMQGWRLYWDGTPNGAIPPSTM